MARPKIALITSFPSYHQVDLFNEVAAIGDLDLRVFYLRQTMPGRQWTRLRQIRHSHIFVREWPRNQRLSVFYVNPHLLGLVRSFLPDVCVVTQAANISMQLIMADRIVRRQPWVFWSERVGGGAVHFSESSLRFRKWLRPLIFFPVRHATQVWGVGRLAVQDLGARAKAACLNVPYFFDLAAFGAIERSEVQGPVRFLFSGRLIPIKGIDLLVDAAEKLVRQGLCFEIVVLGDGPERLRIDQTADTVRSVFQLQGFRELTEVPDVYARADVLVCPSWYDGWGMVVAEAMAAGMPVISTAQTGSAVDMVRDGENGFLLPAPDARLLADAMRLFIENPRSILPMGAQAREMAEFYTARNGASILAENASSLARAQR